MAPDIVQIYCPYCAMLIPENSTICIHCEHELHSGTYVIVTNGLHYAISLRGEIKVHGLTKESAKAIVSILNEYLA